jgi:hypothetical protein
VKAQSAPAVSSASDIELSFGDMQLSLPGDISLDRVPPALKSAQSLQSVLSREHLRERAHATTTRGAQ